MSAFFLVFCSWGDQSGMTKWLIALDVSRILESCWSVKKSSILLINTHTKEADGPKIKFFQKCQNVFFSAQNILDPLHPLYIHFFIPKVLIKDPKMLNLRRIKNDKSEPSYLCASLTHLSEQTQAKRLLFMEKIWIKARLEIKITQAVCCSHPQNI